MPKRLVARASLYDRPRAPGYFQIVRNTLSAWEKDPALGFPQPVIINGKKFYDVAELDAWIERRRSEAAA